MRTGGGSLLNSRSHGIRSEDLQLGRKFFVDTAESAVGKNAYDIAGAHFGGAELHDGFDVGEDTGAADHWALERASEWE